MNNATVKIIQFSNQTRQDLRLLKKYVNFHWQHYKDEPRFIPLLDYEYLGFKLLGVTGFFEPKYHFFQHGEMQFFLAYKDKTVVGRTCAFINHNHNNYYQDKVGFFGFFESIDDPTVATVLLDAAASWLKSKGMTAIRGPQNLPINEATPGALIQGFDAVPMIYYHFNYPYYGKLFENYGMQMVKKVVGWQVPVQTPVQERLLKVAEKVKLRYDISLEYFSRIRFKVLREYMFEIYNEAWKDNWGFVPFTKAEFFSNLEDMKLIWDPKMFIFAFVKGEPAAFFGSVPNVLEKMHPIPLIRRWELVRAARMLLTKGFVKSFRQGYFGIRPKFRKMGLDAILLSEAKCYTQRKGYQDCDIGWVLENNELVLRAADFMGGQLSRTYAIFQKDI